MKDQYEQNNDDQFQQFIGLGRRNHKISKNQQIYCDFYQAYQPQQKTQQKPTYNHKNYRSSSAYNNFKIGSTIQNYAAQSQVFIPEPKKKVKLNQFQKYNQEQQQIDQPNVIGQFNLKSFLKQFQQKQQLEQIQEEQDQNQDDNAPLCLNQKIKKLLKLVKIGEESSEDQEEITDINQMSFQQYQKLITKNKSKINNKEEKIKKLTPEQKQKQNEFIQGYGIGYKMLSKMGFNLTKGLGKQQKGISKPIEAVFKTAFTTKDSQLKQQSQKQEQQQKTQQQLPAQQQIFQYRSKDKQINNFLIDLKNKYQSLKSKIYFYQRQVNNFNRDLEINNSLKLQKLNQIQSHNQELNKLLSLLNYGKYYFEKNNEKNQKDCKNKYPHLTLQYKMDLLYLKNSYIKLKQMSNIELYQKFPTILQEMKLFLFNLYLQKQIQTIKNYKNGMKNFKDSKNKVINLEQDQIDIVNQGPTQDQTVVSLSFQQQSRIINMLQLVCQNSIFPKLMNSLNQINHLGQITNFKMFQCIRALKKLNKKSELAERIIKEKIKPLLLSYYQNFQLQQIKQNNQNLKSQTLKQLILPHLIIFPLFQVLEPSQMEINRFFKLLSKKLWSTKNKTFYNIIKPLLQFCSPSQKDHFINFYIVPRFLYQLQEFDLTQPSICKDLMAAFKLYKQFFNNQIRKQLLNATIIPELVMTYKNYQQQGMKKQDLNIWIKRWSKQIAKIVPQYLQETFFNDFQIQI